MTKLLGTYVDLEIQHDIAAEVWAVYINKFMPDDLSLKESSKLSHEKKYMIRISIKDYPQRTLPEWEEYAIQAFDEAMLKYKLTKDTSK